MACLEKSNCDFCDARCPYYYDNKDLKEIINFLLKEIEDEHMGMKEIMIEEIKKNWRIDLCKMN